MQIKITERLLRKILELPTASKVKNIGVIDEVINYDFLYKEKRTQEAKWETKKVRLTQFAFDCKKYLYNNNCKCISDNFGLVKLENIKDANKIYFEINEFNEPIVFNSDSEFKSIINATQWFISEKLTEV